MILLKICLGFQTLGLFYFQQSKNNFGEFFSGILELALLAGIIIFIIWFNQRQKTEGRRREQKETANMSPEEKAQYYERQSKLKEVETYGAKNLEMVCQHCQMKGQVRTKKIMQKKGISGSKAAGAVLTGGISVLATGLSKKDVATQAHCDNCSNTWYF